MDMPFTVALPVYIDLTLLGFTEPAPAELRDIVEAAGCTLTRDENGLPNFLVEPADQGALGLRVRMLVLLNDQPGDVPSYGHRLATGLRAALRPARPLTLRISSVSTVLSTLPNVTLRV